MTGLAAGLGRVLGQWGLSPRTELALLAVSENVTFIAIDPDTGQRTVLRVHRPEYHSRQEIESELEWTASLRASSIVSTPAIMPTLDGTRVAQFDDAGRIRHVVAFEFMAGSEPVVEQALVPGFEQLGAISARLHAHARKWLPGAGFVRKTWDFDTTIGSAPHWGPWHAALNLDTGGRHLLAETVELLREELARYGQGEARFGLVHADLRLANLLIDGDQINVIDFDDCGFSWFVYDFAAAVSFIEEQPLVPDLLDAWLAGYRSVAPLPTEDEAAIALMIMLRRILLTAWVASHQEAPVAQALGAAYTEGTLRLARRFMDTGSPLLH